MHAAESRLRPAVFLDKDGTLIENVPYNADPTRIRLAPGAGQALATLQWAGYALVVVSNQPGVAHGFFPEGALSAVYARLEQLLGAFGVRLEGFYYCPHHPQGTQPPYNRVCNCRKPQAGLLERAAAERGLALRRSWMIGDILNDVEAGNRAGCRTILLDTGGETEWEISALRTPWGIAPNLIEAARQILVGELMPGEESLPDARRQIQAAAHRGKGTCLVGATTLGQGDLL